MADLVTTAAAARALGINSTSITNAAVSGNLGYSMVNGQMLVDLAEARSLAAAAGVRPRPSRQALAGNWAAKNHEKEQP